MGSLMVIIAIFGPMALGVLAVATYDELRRRKREEEKWRL